MIEEIKSAIIDVPNFPKQGILYRDIMPILSDKGMFKFIVDTLAERLRNQSIELVMGIESRGFLFGPSLAQKLGVGFVPVRKKGKLPGKTWSMNYGLEYGEDAMEVQRNSFKAGQNIHIHDDLLATGGTAEALSKLLINHNAIINSYSFVVELSSLNGQSKLKPFSNLIESVITF